jgi:hypothetical protein
LFKSYRAGAPKQTNGSILKVALIPLLTGTAIVFRCESLSSRVASWSEKIFKDAVCTVNTWAYNFGFDSNILYWSDNNIPQKNERGYRVPLFVITTEDIPTHSAIILLGKTICSNINKAEGNNTVISVQEDNYFWLGDDAVWSDIIGYQQSYDIIVAERGLPQPGFYEMNRDYIHTHYKFGTFSAQTAEVFFAPEETLHPSLH